MTKNDDGISANFKGLATALPNAATMNSMLRGTCGEIIEAEAGLVTEQLPWMDQWDHERDRCCAAEVQGDMASVHSALELAREAADHQCLKGSNGKALWATILDALGQAYFCIGDKMPFEQMFASQEAGLKYLKDSMRAFSEIYGPRHPRVGLQAQHLGTALILMGRFEDAKPLLHRALATGAIAGKIMPQYFSCLINLITSAHAETHDEEGLTMYQGALNSCFRSLRRGQIAKHEANLFAMMLHNISSLLLLNDTLDVPCAAKLFEDVINQLEELTKAENETNKELQTETCTEKSLRFCQPPVAPSWLLHRGGQAANVTATPLRRIVAATLAGASAQCHQDHHRPPRFMAQSDLDAPKTIERNDSAVSHMGVAALLPTLHQELALIRQMPQRREGRDDDNDYVSSARRAASIRRGSLGRSGKGKGSGKHCRKGRSPCRKPHDQTSA